MKVSDAIIEYLKAEVIPHIAGESDFTAAVINGALRTGKKKISEKISSFSVLEQLGVCDHDGNIDPDAAKEFVDGFFEGREKVGISLSEIMKSLTGIECESELLAGKLNFTRKDGEKLLELLKR